MVNTWTLYQAETCVVWSRFASFIEVGGRTGLGYRDTSQDVMSVVHTNPAKCRQRIVELLHGQVSQGYGLHLFDPDWFDPEKQKAPTFKSPTIAHAPDIKSIIHGIEHACSDDALWIVANHLRIREGDRRRRVLRRGRCPSPTKARPRSMSTSSARWISRAEQVGQTGICLGLRADWNDCLNLGGGESAMVSFLHHWALRAFIEAADILGRDEDVQKYSALAEKVRAGLRTRTVGRRVVHPRHHRQGREDRLAGERGRQGLHGEQHLGGGFRRRFAASTRSPRWMPWIAHLYSELWHPSALAEPSPSPTTISASWRASIKGIKENGAIFSHPNPWAVIAECKLGRGERAMKFYDSPAALQPERQDRDPRGRACTPIASS